MKPGDRVRCIKTWNKGDPSDGCLTLGKTYTLLDVTDGHEPLVKLMFDDGHITWCYAMRFKPYGVKNLPDRSTHGTNGNKY